MSPMLSPRFNQRILIIRFGFMLFFCALVVRLFFIQIIYAPFYAQYARQQYHITLKETPPRALIYDRHNKPLALNHMRLAAFITPRSLHNAPELKKFLNKHFPAAFEKLKQQPQASFMYIKRKLTDRELALINHAQLEDIFILEEPQRYYTNPTLLPVIGLTDIDNHGLFGLELYCDKTLRGTTAIFSVEKEAKKRGYYFKKELHAEGTHGEPVFTTLDSTLQFLAYEEVKETVERLEAEEGAALIMDPQNGDILACVNYPIEDYHQTTSLDFEKIKNKVFTDVHEFGSVMKIFPALAALEEKVVTPDEIIDCENTKLGFINGIRISTWKAHGILPYTDVVAFSNNIGTSKVAARLGPKLYHHLRRVGFGKKTGITFPGEVAGFINPPEKWTTQSPFSLSFGYEINATLLQLASAFTLIARNGTTIKPRILLSEPIQAGCEQLYSQKTLDAIHLILQRTITDGTAHRAKIKGYTVEGKTGTANLLKDGIYNPDENIFTFAAIVQKEAYQRVIVVFIKKSKFKNVYASSIAVPLFEKIAQQMIIHEQP